MPKPLIYTAIGLAALIGLFLLVLIVRAVAIKGKKLYLKRESMLSDAENYFYFLVKDILPDGYILVPQPPVIALLEPVSGDIVLRNRIVSKRFDFCIAKFTEITDFPFRALKNIAVIELDDRTHEQAARRERDEFIEEICFKANLPLLRFRCKSNSHPDYNIRQIKQDICNIIDSIKAG